MNNKLRDILLRCIEKLDGGMGEDFVVDDLFDMLDEEGWTR